MDSTIRSSDAELDRQAAARDCWPGGTLQAWHGAPQPLPDRVFWPEDEQQVHAVLREASARRIPVVTYGAGSGVCGGARGRPGAWVLDTKALSRIGPLDEERWTVRVQAGVNGQHLEDWLQRRGFTLGHSPSSIACSTVGGWAAARSAGQFSSKYGVFEDMVLGVRGVAPSIGPFSVGEGGDRPDDWLELLLGSEGTLAVLTELELRVWPAPASRVLAGWHLPDVPTALGVMRALMQGELHPAVVRLYDPVDTRIGGRTRPKGEPRPPSEAVQLLRRWLKRVDRVSPVHRNSLVLPLALPRLVNGLLDRFSSGCLLIVGWEGDPQVVEATSRAGRALLDAAGTPLGPEPGERWYASRHAVSYKLMPIFERGGFADTMEVAARWSDVERTYRAVRTAVSRTAVVMAHMSHVYPEGACIYFSFAGRGDEAVYAETWKAALDAVLASGATVAHHHGIGESKAEAASREIGPAIRIWRGLKSDLDPQGILNPGRLFVDVPPDDPGPLRPPDPQDQLGTTALGAARGANPGEATPVQAPPEATRTEATPTETRTEATRTEATRTEATRTEPTRTEPTPVGTPVRPTGVAPTPVGTTPVGTNPVGTNPVGRPAGAASASEPLWPFERLPGPARWHRSPWQNPWIEVAGTLDGRRFVLGRGPRSAVGPDLRSAVAHQPDAVATFAVAAPGERWMGEGRPASPWRVARDLLRSDLRPAVLTVRDGALRVGFRGPAARALGAIAAGRVPGGLTEVPYRPESLAAGPLVACEPDDPGAVAVTAQGVLRRSA